MATVQGPAFGGAGHLGDHIFLAIGAEVLALCLFHFGLFVTIDYAQSYEGRIFPRRLPLVVMTRNQTCYPQMSDHTPNPTCFLLWLEKQVVLTAWPKGSSVSRGMENKVT